jgi:hypothetical protein
MKFSLERLLSPAPPKTYLSLCCIFKDENEYLEEWMRYYLAIGVEHFYFYDNGSKIHIKKTLKALGLLKYATVRSIRGKTKQVRAYGDCLKEFGAKSQWIGFIDMDEFIVPKATNGDLPKFLKDYELYGGLGINWLIFGSNGHQTKPDESQLESFTKRSEVDFHVNKHIKSIVQPRFVKNSQSAHFFTYISGKFCVNENFVPIEAAFSEPSVNKIQLNHYFTRSLQEFEIKIKRGIADNVRKRTIDEFYHHDNDANKITDTMALDILKKRSDNILSE